MGLEGVLLDDLAVFEGVVVGVVGGGVVQEGSGDVAVVEALNDAEGAVFKEFCCCVSLC